MPKLSTPVVDDKRMHSFQRVVLAVTIYTDNDPLFLFYFMEHCDRLCGLVVRVSGYRYRGLGFDSRRYQIFWVVVALERGPLSLVRSIEELLE